MDRLTSSLSAAGGFPAAGAFPAVNVYAGQGGIAVVAELPGVEKDDLEIQAHRDTLTLRGVRRPVSEGTEAYHRRERGGRPCYPSHYPPYPHAAERISAAPQK